MRDLAHVIAGVLAAANRRLEPDQLGDLEAALVVAMVHSRQCWPNVRVDDAAFLTYLAARLPDDPAPAAALATLEVSDLYLCCACLAGDEAAIEHFERCFVTEIPGYVARYVRGAPELDELKQTVRVRLLVAGLAAAPQLASYRGRGPLGAWLRVVAVRAALDQVRRRPRDHTSNNSAPAPADAELALLKAQYAPAFQRAFAATLAALPGRERTMLRLHFVDGMTLTAIARSFQVNASTVHRAIDRARDRVLSETMALLANDLGVGITQADSIARLVQSRLDLDLRRCLATDAA